MLDPCVSKGFPWAFLGEKCVSCCYLKRINSLKRLKKVHQGVHGFDARPIPFNTGGTAEAADLFLYLNGYGIPYT